MCRKAREGLYALSPLAQNIHCDRVLGTGKPGYVHMDEEKKFPNSFLSFFLTFRDAGILTIMVSMLLQNSGSYT